MADGYTLLVDGFSNIAANVGLFKQLITGATLAQATGTRILHIPYRGAQAAYQDLLSGRVDLFLTMLERPNNMWIQRRSRHSLCQPQSAFPECRTCPPSTRPALAKVNMERNDPSSGYFGRIRDVIG